MTPDNQALLWMRYPRLLWTPADSGLPIDCGDGWFDLVDVLCEKLQGEADGGDAPQPVILQVKQKCGVLRVYAKQTNAFQQGLIAMAEAMSVRISEG